MIDVLHHGPWRRFCCQNLVPVGLLSGDVQLRHYVHDLGVIGLSTTLPQDLDNVVTAPGKQISIAGDNRDPRLERDLFALQAGRVTGPVPSFVCVLEGDDHLRVEAETPSQHRTNLTMSGETAGVGRGMGQGGSDQAARVAALLWPEPTARIMARVASPLPPM